MRQIRLFTDLKTLLKAKLADVQAATGGTLAATNQVQQDRMVL
jgi:hypothetical protein